MQLICLNVYRYSYQVYIDFLCKVHELASVKYGKQMLYWGDIVLKYVVVVVRQTIAAVYKVVTNINISDDFNWDLGNPTS